MDVVEIGNLSDFIDLIKEQYRTGQGPPSGDYPPMDEFLPAVHDVLIAVIFVNEAVNPEYDTEESEEGMEEDEPEEADLSPEEISDPDPAIASPIESGHENGFPPPNMNSIVPDPQMDLPDPNLVDPDSAVLTPEGPDMEDDMFAIDLDLYDQPFALDPALFQAIPASPTPEPPLEISPTVQETEPSRPSGVARHFKYEPEFLPYVGIINLQPLSFDHISFAIDSSVLAPEYKYSFTRPYDKLVLPEPRKDEKMKNSDGAEDGSDGDTTWTDF